MTKHERAVVDNVVRNIEGTLKDAINKEQFVFTLQVVSDRLKALLENMPQP